MPNLRIVAGLVATALVVGYLVLLAVLAGRSRRAPRLEPRDGQLKSCARRGNCVNTQEGNSEVEPLRFTGSAEVAWQRLRGVVQGLPRTRLLADTEGYLRAESASRFFGFRDDLEALLDRKNAVIHLRSASRVGLRDRGVNRRRVERLRQRFEAAAGGG